MISQVSKVIDCVLGIYLFLVMIERAFGESQYAYHPKRGARDAVLLYVATWLKMVNDGKKIGVYCSDVSGAFDRVCGARLLNKLASLGLHRDLYGVVKSWFVIDRRLSL